MPNNVDVNMVIALIASVVIFVTFMVLLQNLMSNTKEGFSKEGQRRTPPENKCPNLLVQVGNEYYLYNTNVQRVPGVNPMVFHSLDEYAEFVKWQQTIGMRCPVLKLQTYYDAQGSALGHKFRVGNNFNAPTSRVPVLNHSSTNMVSAAATADDNAAKPTSNDDFINNTYTDVLPPINNKQQPDTTSVKPAAITQPPPQTNFYNESTIHTMVAGPAPSVDSKQLTPNNAVKSAQEWQQEVSQAQQKGGANNAYFPLLSNSKSDELLYAADYSSSEDDNKKKKEKELPSVNPMDDNWGGAIYTKMAVDAGAFQSDQVNFYVASSS